MTSLRSSPYAHLGHVPELVDRAQDQIHQLLRAFPSGQGIAREAYVRYLSMQHHLTHGVQRHFFACAAHPSMQRRPALRRFLLAFGIEEEPHFALAANDLEVLGEPVGPPPLDVELWWAFFDRLVATRPFGRLGATCVLESISTKANDHLRELMAHTDYLTPGNTRFVTIHQHEAVPHGPQVLSALDEAKLDTSELADLERGARDGGRTYLRMAREAVQD